MLHKKDYYKILGISPNANRKAIDDSYRKLVIKYHPSRYKEKDAQERIAEINEAYSTLSNDVKRREYDHYLRYGHETNRAHSAQTNENFRQADDFFSEFDFSSFASFFGFNNESAKSSSKSYNNFGGDNDNRRNDKDTMGDNNSYPHSDGNDNLDIKIRLTLEEWYNGCSKRINYKRMEKCAECKINTQVCPKCRGSRYTTTVLGFIKTTQPCGTCHAVGQVKTISFCGKCKKGRNEKDISVEVRIPACSKKIIVLASGGNYLLEEEAYGRLVMHTEIDPHKQFKVSGNDITCEIEVGIEDVIFGSKFKMVYLDNSTITITIPKAPAGDLLAKPYVILKGMGVKRAGEPSGNLVVNILIKNNLSVGTSKDEFMKTNSMSKVKQTLYQQIE